MVTPTHVIYECIFVVDKIKNLFLKSNTRITTEIYHCHLVMNKNYCSTCIQILTQKLMNRINS